jgi:1-acyl-sn-glycerol-3-phosphate acyltransferase
MRSLAFNIAFGLISFICTMMAALAALRPGRGAVRRVIALYVRRMVWAMAVFAKIRLEVRGRERLPSGSFILAPKHASYGDGFSIYAQFEDLAFVTGDHLERFPLFKTVLNKLGAIVVDNCGGPEARAALSRSAAHAHAEGRKILIYPEGHLAPHGPRLRLAGGPGRQQPGCILVAGELDPATRAGGPGISGPHCGRPGQGRHQNLIVS